MESKHQQLFFPQLLRLSLGLLVFSLVLTFSLDYEWSAFGRVGWWAIPIGIALACLSFIVPVFFISHRWLRLPSFYSLTSQLHEMSHHFSWSQIVIISILAGISEELIFRGALQSWLTEAIGIYSAVLISSLVFGLLHAMTLYYFLFTFLLSLFLGVVFYLSQSMLLLSTLHAFYDIIALGVIAKYPHYLGLNVDYDNELKL